MSKEEIAEVQELLLALERRIRPLEWDSSKNQINEYRKQHLEKLNQEQDILRKRLDELRQL